MFRTLLVEDNEAFRDTLHDVLAEQFPAVQILEAGNGRDALGIVAALHPHLVFLDIKLPDDNGLDLTRRIKEIDPAIVVVILTSHDLPEYRQAAFRNGASCFICKQATSPDDVAAVVHGSMTNRYLQ